MAAAGSVVGICGLDLTLHPRTQQPVVVYNFDLFSEKLGREIFFNRLQCCLHFHCRTSRRGGTGLDLEGGLEEAGYLFKLARRQPTAEAAKAGRG